MQFKIVGASADSGDDVDVLLEASTQTAVEQLAHDRGILVSSIMPVAPMTPAVQEDPNSIALVDDEPVTNGTAHRGERAHGVITVNANTPGETAHSSTDGHIAEQKHADAAMEFHIIMNQSLYLLESAVNKHIRDGWEPQGSVTVATSNNALQYFQSMIRRKKVAVAAS